VAEGVAEIQDRPPPVFPLVFAHDGRLDLARACDGMGERLHIPIEQLFDVRVQPIEEAQVRHAAVLDHFR
jgi:hypothetical protein